MMKKLLAIVLSLVMFTAASAALPKTKPSASFSLPSMARWITAARASCRAWPRPAMWRVKI